MAMHPKKRTKLAALNLAAARLHKRVPVILGRLQQFQDKKITLASGGLNKAFRRAFSDLEVGLRIVESFEVYQYTLSFVVKGCCFESTYGGDCGYQQVQHSVIVASLKDGYLVKVNSLHDINLPRQDYTPEEITKAETEARNLEERAQALRREHIPAAFRV